MPGCCAVSCTNSRDKGFRMFRFPLDAGRRADWAVKVGREGWTPTSNSRLCQAHFSEEQFECARQDGRKLLKSSAVPDIFSHRQQKKYRRHLLKRTSCKSYEVEEQNKSDHTYCSQTPDRSQESGTGTSDRTVGTLIPGFIKESTLPLQINEQHLEDNRCQHEKLRKLRSTISSLHKRLSREKRANASLKNNLKSFLNDDQISSLTRKSNKGQKWSMQTVRKALQIRFAAGKSGYETLLNSSYPLPSDRTLRRRRRCV